MIRFIIALGLAISAPALANDDAAPHTVDLRAPQALEQLHRSNPAHFTKIQQVLDGLREQPRRAGSSFDSRSMTCDTSCMSPAAI